MVFPTELAGYLMESIRLIVQIAVKPVLVLLSELPAGLRLDSEIGKRESRMNNSMLLCLVKSGFRFETAIYNLGLIPMLLAPDCSGIAWGALRPVSASQAIGVSVVAKLGLNPHPRIRFQMCSSLLPSVLKDHPEPLA